MHRSSETLNFYHLQLHYTGRCYLSRSVSIGVRWSQTTQGRLGGWGNLLAATQHTGQSNTQSFHSNTTQQSNRCTQRVSTQTQHTGQSNTHTNRVSTQTQHTGQSNTQSHIYFHSNTTHWSNRCTHRVAFETHLSTHVDHSGIYVESSYLVTTSSEK